MPYCSLSDGVRLHYSIALGKSPQTLDHPTLIFHHGMGSSQNYYYSIIPSLAERGFTCIAFDMVGSGRSSPIADISPLSFDILAGHLIELIGALKVNGPIVLVGHSLGTLVLPRVLVDDRMVDNSGEDVHGRRVVGAILIAPVLPTETVKAALGPRVQRIEKGENFYYLLKAYFLSQTDIFLTSSSCRWNGGLCEYCTSCDYGFTIDVTPTRLRP
jgi:pimeloyl-ACP methyl ester carboxylesterase